MGIVLGSQFSVQTALPLDDRDTVADNTARDAINSGRRYIGFKTFSIASLKTYQLQTGITNSDWVDVSASTALTTADSLTAHAGGGQGSALALTAQINRVTTVATAGDSVKLPAATAGAQVMVINAAASNSMDIFPATGEAIDALGTNIQYPLTVTARNVTFVCVTNGTWISKAGGGGSSAPTATDSITAHAGGGQGSATALTSDINRITTVTTSGDSVKLPAATAGKSVIIINDGSNSTDIFPASGESIDSLATNAAFPLSTITRISTFVCAVAGLWRSEPIGRPRSASTGLTAHAGGGQGSALALTSDINRVTTVATAADSVKLPPALPGLEIVVINDGASAMDIFPASGEAIDSLATNSAYSLTTINKNVRLICASAGLWKSASGGGSGSGGYYVASGSNASPTAIASFAIIPYDYTLGARQVYFLKGTGGETLAGTPQIAAGTTVGYELLLIGCDDTNYLRFFDGNGMSINGEMYLYNKCSILLFWDGSNWFETSRGSR